jgi:hypothetical protein
MNAERATVCLRFDILFRSTSISGYGALLEIDQTDLGIAPDGVENSSITLPSTEESILLWMR